MDKKLEEFNWVVGDSARSGLRNTSHTARLDRQALSRTGGGTSTLDYAIQPWSAAALRHHLQR